jgi:putative ABC transport system permease protein
MLSFHSSQEVTMISITWPALSLAFIPMAVVVSVIYSRVGHSMKSTLYATARMVVQLGLVGFVLKFLFAEENPLILGLTLLFMLTLSSWISLHSIKHLRRKKFLQALVALSIGGFPTLAIILLGVLQLDSWVHPKFAIPLGGMILANSMNALSLAAERFEKELQHGESLFQSRKTALEAALIPLTNTFFAVGLVSFPGMMTGQILAGAEPLMAARYQIMVMAMAFGASGLAAGIYLLQQKESPKTGPFRC